MLRIKGGHDVRSGVDNESPVGDFCSVGLLISIPAHARRLEFGL